MGEFYEMRNSLFLGTVIVALVGSLITGLLYSWQSSLNYLLGTGVGLVYLNMLAKAVERVGEKKKKCWDEPLTFVCRFDDCGDKNTSTRSGSHFYWFYNL